MLNWRTIFSRYPGQFRTILYFACLGLGYIMVEVSLIAKFVLPLGNPTVSASILITGMLVFSGLGSLASERFMERAKTVMPLIFIAIGAMLIAYGWLLDPALNAIGSLPYALRLVCCFVLIAPPAFLMGFPMSTAMTLRAPASLEPRIAASPTPPQPKTATVSPREMPPVYMAAPSPAMTPHPMRPATSGGALGSTRTACPASTSVSSANAPMPSAALNAVPS